MKPARIAIIGVAVVAGLAAAYLANGGRESASPPIAPELEKIAASEVLVAATDLPLGTKLGAVNLKWLPWPAEGVAPGMILRKDAPDAIAQNSGSLVRETFVANEPVTKDKLIKTDAGYLSAILPEGKRALAISIDQRGSNSAGTLILPNDHVDVIHIYKDWRATQSQGSDVYASETLLQNIRVLAIGPNIEEKNGERVAVGETATLELGPSEVNTIALAQRSGTLTLALRSVADANAPEVVADKDAELSVIRYGVRSFVGGKN
jgi:pilus assembly protein CpaB